LKTFLSNTSLFIIISFYLGSYFGQHGVGSNWQNEVLLPIHNVSVNPKQRGVLYNNMIVTSGGRIIISTSELNRSNINQIYGHYLTYSDDGGNTWSSPIRFTPIDMVIGGSSLKLAIDKNDNIFALWNSFNPNGIFISKLDTNLNVVTDSVRVSSKMAYGNFATHMTIDRKGRIHVMWHEGSTNSTNIAESYYTRSTNGGINWSTTVPISTIDGHHSAFPHAQFDTAGDTLAIAWRDSVGGTNKWDVYIVYSINGGSSWTSPIPSITTSDSDWDPDLIIDNFNRIHLFYTKYPTSNPFWGARNYYQYTDNLGVVWNLPISPSSGIFSGNYRSQLIEGTRYDEKRNILYVTWKDERDFNTTNGNVQGDIMLAYSTDRGLNWMSPEFITDRNDSTIGFKAGAILANGEYAVNYEVMSEDDINNPNTSVRVYFRKRALIPTSNDDKLFQLDQFYLFQNYPNPFNPSTKISWQSPVGSWQTLKVYDILGNEVATLVNEFREAGRYEIEFNTVETRRGVSLPSGVYFYQLKVGDYIQTNKMILAR
jgi:hypothetical protein